LERLHRRENVIASERSLAGNPELAEGTVMQDIAECRKTLLQDFMPMRHEEKSSWRIPAAAQAQIVECRNDGLTGPGGSN
jgi:hypothetical protein